MISTRRVFGTLICIAITLFNVPFINAKSKDKTDFNPSVLIGNTLPQWSEGYLDIHSINTGRGECTLFIMPDGTTMLVDGASSTISPTASIPPPPLKPNAESKPENTIINYIRHFIAPANDHLDYTMISHWHPDHIGGSVNKKCKFHESGKFRLVGLTEICSSIKTDKIIDRDYMYPYDMTRDKTIKNFVNFLDWSKHNNGLTEERFVVGANNQVHLTKNPNKYKNLSIRNIIGEGRVWTGKSDNATNLFPEDTAVINAAKPNENIFSLGFMLKYGNFKYFTAGDIQYKHFEITPWFDVETPVAKVVSHVSAFKASHHGTLGTNNAAILNALSPDAIVIGVWRDVQPNAETIDRMFDVKKDCKIFTTNLTDKNIERLGSERVSKFKCTNGHVVIRVLPGGKQYYIFVLNDSDENYTVEKVFGPYKSKK